MAYSIDQLQKARGRAAAPTAGIADIPADAPHDTDDALGVWNGERFVSWDEWRATSTRQSRHRPQLAAKGNS